MGNGVQHVYIEWLEAYLLFAVTATPFMPRLMALEASKTAAVLALYFITSPPLDNVFLALQIGAPDCVWIQINSTRQMNLCAFGILFLG